MRPVHIAHAELASPVSEYPGKQSLGVLDFFRLLYGAESHNRVTYEHRSKLNRNVHRLFVDFGGNGAACVKRAMEDCCHPGNGAGQLTPPILEVVQGAILRHLPLDCVPKFFPRPSGRFAETDIKRLRVLCPGDRQQRTQALTKGITYVRRHRNGLVSTASHRRWGHHEQKPRQKPPTSKRLLLGQTAQNVWLWRQNQRKRWSIQHDWVAGTAIDSDRGSRGA